MTTDPILSTDILEKIRLRNLAVEKIRQAVRTLAEAAGLEKRATGESRSAIESYLVCRGGLYLDDHGIETLRKELDASLWEAFISQSGVRAILSSRALSDMDGQISRKEAPEFIPEAVQSTFADWSARKADMLEDGVVDLFRSLSWDYKTHNPVHITRKIIVNYLLDSYGLPNVYGTGKLDDLVRALSVYDGKPVPESRNDMYRKVSDAIGRGGTWEADSPYFRLKIYKKGTGHVIFKPCAFPLIDQMNRVIARRFPNVLAQESRSCHA